MKKAILPIMTLVLIIALAACGQANNKSEEDNNTSHADNEKETVTNEEEADTDNNNATSGVIELTDATGQTLSFEEAPASFATLDSGVLGILQALDANIVGRPTASQTGDETLEDISEIGNPHEPNFEMIAKENPEILIASSSFKQHEENLKDQGTQPIYTEANSIQDIQDTIHTIGVLLGKEPEADELNASIDADIQQIETADTAVKTLLVYGAPGSYLAALPNSLSGDLLEKAGGENIAADFPAEADYPQYASISSEKIIEKNPERIMLITHGDPEGVKKAFEEEMNEHPTWKNLDAVQNDQVIILPPDLFGSNPGIRVSEALQIMQENLAEAK